MQRKKIVIGASIITVFCVVVLSGCAKKNTEPTQIQNMAQNQNTQSSQNGVVQKDDDGKGGKKPAMPAEAIAVCADKSVGDTCTVEMIGPENSTTTMSGACQAQPDNTEELACMSQNMQGGPQRGHGPSGDVSE
ncbi:MAG: hypothetical protein WC819_00800 [Parcubacteria group bacterium]|jgi:hypothetical protein